MQKKILLGWNLVLSDFWGRWLWFQAKHSEIQNNGSRMDGQNTKKIYIHWFTWSKLCEKTWNVTWPHCGHIPDWKRLSSQRDGKFFSLLSQTNYKLTDVSMNQTIIVKPITNDFRKKKIRIFENYILTNDHLERVVRRPYPAVDPNERAIAHKFSRLHSLQEKFTLGKIKRDKLMHWFECLTEKLAVGIPHSTEYCRNMSEIFPIFHCTWNIVAIFLSNIAKCFTATLQF